MPRLTLLEMLREQSIPRGLADDIEETVDGYMSNQPTNKASERLSLCVMGQIAALEGDNLRDEPIGDGVAERDEHQGNEGWNSVTDVLPVDTDYLTHHHATDLMAELATRVSSG